MNKTACLITACAFASAAVAGLLQNEDFDGGSASWNYTSAWGNYFYTDGSDTIASMGGWGNDLDWSNTSIWQSSVSNFQADTVYTLSVRWREAPNGDPIDDIRLLIQDVTAGWTIISSALYTTDSGSNWNTSTLIFDTAANPSVVGHTIGVGCDLTSGSGTWVHIDSITLRDDAPVTTPKIIINPHITWGIWEGWGTSLSWWAAKFGSRNDLANILFTTNTSSLYANNGNVQLPGLGMNIARYNVGACSWNTYNGASMQESPNIYASRQISGFWLDWGSTNPASSSWDWSVDANQLSMLIKAQDRGADHLELFSNSPMWWMCYNNNPSGADVGADDNLNPAYYDEHAIYLATIARYAQDNWGISFDSVDPFNEPSANWWDSNGRQIGCHFDRSTQETVIGLLRDELDNRNLASTIIAASDETSYDDARATWNSFSASTQAKVGRVNVHGYQGAGGQRDLLYDDANGKTLWNSEYGDNDASGLSLARNLNLDFRWLRLTAWCYWQPLDWANWGLIDANLESSWVGQPERKYYVLAHYTRHIRSGMTILDGSHDNTVIAYSAAERKLAIVTMNYETPQTITYDLSSFFEAAGPVRRWTTETGSNISYESANDIVIGNKIFSAPFAANTIQTFEIQNVDIYPYPHLTLHPLTKDSAVLVTWPTLYPGFNLYEANTLTNFTAWNLVTNSPSMSTNQYQVTVPVYGNDHKYFRLSNP